MPSSLQPIPLKNPLAPTPTKAPLFSKSFTLNSGETIDLVCPKSTRAMVACMDMNAVLGGAASHYGGPAAFAELMSASFGFAFYKSKQTNTPWYELFHMVNDAGHCENGIYALKANYGFADLNINSLKSFRSIKSKLTGHGESHLFPEGVFLSNGPLGSSLPQAQGLALADALTNSKRVSVCAISDGAAMEGEAKEAFTAIPGFAKRGKLAPFICILSDNNTKLSGRISEDSYDLNQYFSSLETTGWHRIVVENGNDLAACLKAFEQAYDIVTSDPTKPVLIHAKTLKGIGTKKTATSSSGGHGFPLSNPKDLANFVSEIYEGDNVPNEILSWVEEIQQIDTSSQKSKPDIPHEKIQVGIAKALVEKRTQGYPIVSVSSDLAGSTGVKAFQSEFPDSTIDVGVAESNMISTAAGLSKTGFIPVVDTFAQFGVTKGALPFLMSSLSQAPMIAIFSHTGFQDAADGASHQALSYLAMLNSIPNLKTFSLSCSAEAYQLLNQALDEFYHSRKANKTPQSYVFFLGRENFPQYYKKDSSYQLGKSQIVFDNSSEFEKNITIVAVGSLVPQAVKAHELLAQQNIGSIIVNASATNNPDLNTIGSALEKTNNKLIIVEDHQAIGGYNNLLCTELVKQNRKITLGVLAVQNKFGQSAYKANELYSKHLIDFEAIVNKAKELIQN